MRFRVVVLPSAESDIAGAVDWIAQHSPIAAARWMEGYPRSHKHAERDATALRGCRRRFGADAVVRQLFYGRRRHRYRILFTVDEGTVYVLRVRHGARTPVPPLDKTRQVITIWRARRHP